MSNPTPIEFEDQNRRLDDVIKNLKEELSAAKATKARPSVNVTTSQINSSNNRIKHCKEEISSIKSKIRETDDPKSILTYKRRLCDMYERLIYLEREHARKYSIAAICGGIAESLGDLSDAIA